MTKNYLWICRRYYNRNKNLLLSREQSDQINKNGLKKGKTMNSATRMLIEEEEAQREKEENSKNLI